MGTQTLYGYCHSTSAKHSIILFLITSSLHDKLKATDTNPYVINWIFDFLSQKQRVVVDGITTEFIDINRGVPQGTVLGPICSP